MIQDPNLEGIKLSAKKQYWFCAGPRTSVGGDSTYLTALPAPLPHPAFATYVQYSNLESKPLEQPWAIHARFDLALALALARALEAERKSCASGNGVREMNGKLAHHIPHTTLVNHQELFKILES
ncbi:hypothetical protein ONS95_013909 [Cadophora gregata]|uniref:uncharacterized protein n=1 Tax=Cadophora gregata TaxID=51156 RepID=UPI0026DC7B14|nr:uncharacterized protein ONS95_013909 [Cadophora gregata]KAK0114417.1 hypothetical protein ONS95_013909 [Cadophora gregata]